MPHLAPVIKERRERLNAESHAWDDGPVRFLPPPFVREVGKRLRNGSSFHLEQCPSMAHQGRDGPEGPYRRRYRRKPILGQPWGYSQHLQCA